jgi:hypothetical protein
MAWIIERGAPAGDGLLFFSPTKHKILAQKQELV